MRLSIRVTLAALVVSCSINVGQAIPQLINYQGILTDGVGTPITVATNVEFRIWDLASGGSELWMETQSVTPDANGVFSVLLGSVNPIPDTALAGAEAYLGTTISPDAEMMPRSQLVSTAFAFRVGSIDGAAAGAMSGDLILKPAGLFAKDAQDPGDPQIILVSTPGDSIYFGPADNVIFRAVDNVEGEYMIAYDDPSKGPLLGIRIDGTEYVEHAVTSSTYYTGTGIKGINAFTKDLEIGRDGVFTYGATDTDTLSELSTAGLKVRDGSGNFSEVKATTAEFKNSSGETTAKIGETGIQVFATGGAKRDPQVVDTIFDFDPVTHSLRIGIDNVASGTNSIAVGTNNTASGNNSVAVGTGNSVAPLNGVAFGQSNTVTSIGGAIGGGTSNTAAFYSVVAGGRFNAATASGGTISGGEYNEVDNNNGTISGGRHNYAAYIVSIGGGEYNWAQADSSTIAGGGADSIFGGAGGAVIGGGVLNRITSPGRRATIAGGESNQISAAFATITGGSSNIASATHAIAGGFDNEASGDYAIALGNGNTASGSNSVAIGTGNTAVSTGVALGHTNSATSTGGTVSGGNQNSAAFYATVSGGRRNTASASIATVGGGEDNTASNEYATVGGGKNNEANWYGTVPGGLDNTSTGKYSLAAGKRAKASHDGTFVWADSTSADFTSSAVNQFSVRASGGTRIYSNSGLTAGVTLAAGGGAWASVSDRNVKRNIRPVDGDELLQKIAQLDVSRWNYESQDPSIEHIGPMAQDFYRLFGVGDNDRTITTVDPDGIALAAIKELSARNAELEARVEELTRLVEQLASER